MIAENIENIDKNNIIICEPIKNSIILHSNFYKIIYSNNYMSLNGLYILFKLNKINIIKDKIIFDISSNKSTVESICDFEKLLLNLITAVSKNKVYKIKEYFNNNCIKYCTNNTNLINSYNNNNFKNISKDTNFFILKISGIWETKENIGVTFKIISVNKYFNGLKF